MSKFDILSYVAEKREPFRVNDVCEELGVSKQLVIYHMNRLIEKGSVARIAYGKYEVIDWVKFSHSLLGEARKVSIAMEDTLWLRKEFTNNATQLIERFRDLENVEKWAKPHQQTNFSTVGPLRNAIVDEIDKSIDSLKRFRRSLLEGEARQKTTDRRMVKYEDDLATGIKYFEGLKLFGAKLPPKFDFILREYIAEAGKRLNR